MKAYSKRSIERMRENAEKERIKRLEEKLANMTPEEREQYDKEQLEASKRAREALKTFATMSSMVRGDYSYL